MDPCSKPTNHHLDEFLAVTRNEEQDVFLLKIAKLFHISGTHIYLGEIYPRSTLLAWEIFLPSSSLKITFYAQTIQDPSLLGIG